MLYSLMNNAFDTRRGGMKMVDAHETSQFIIKMLLHAHLLRSISELQKR